ncbi:hypothetical protein FDECE_16198, partial [Fusarium decemcellulare]
MGKKSSKAASPKSDAAASAPPPGQLMDLVESFLSDHSFKGAHDAFKKQREKKGWQASATSDDQANPSLVSVFETWEASKGEDGTSSRKEKSAEAESSSSEDSDSSDDS